VFSFGATVVHTVHVTLKTLNLFMIDVLAGWVGFWLIGWWSVLITRGGTQNKLANPTFHRCLCHLSNINSHFAISSEPHSLAYNAALPFY
jgi:hypothetical protein